MKYTLVTMADGDVIKENIIEVTPGDKIIAIVDTSNPHTQDNIYNVHKNIMETLQGESNVLTIPDWVSLKILKVE